MTFDRLTGVCIDETVAEYSAITSPLPMYIIETGTELAAFDNKLSLITDFDEFKTTITAINNHNLTQTLKFIEDALLENGYEQFFVYSVKANTVQGYKNVIIETSLNGLIREVYYFEETKSTTPSLNNKMTALITAANTVATEGSNRRIFLIPYATVEDAVSNAENTTIAQAMITSLTSILNGVCDGRGYCIFPDSLRGAVAGKIDRTPYNEDIGKNGFKTSITSLPVPLTKTEMLTLKNLGVIFVREKMYQGTPVYKIEEGVSTSANSTKRKADNTLIKRRIVDEVRTEVKDACDPYVLELTNKDSQAFLQTDVNDAMAPFIKAQEIEEDSSLTVESVSPLILRGGVKPVGCIETIDIDLTFE